MSTTNEDLIQPLIGVLNNNQNQQHQNGTINNNSSAALPSRAVASAYLKKKPVAQSLDSIITELFTKQPEDPERHILEFLLKRNPQYVQQLTSSSSTFTVEGGSASTLIPQPPSSQNPHHQHSHHHHHGSSSLLLRQDSGPVVSPGDGAAPRGSSGVENSASSSSNSNNNNNNNTSVTAAGGVTSAVVGNNNSMTRRRSIQQQQQQQSNTNNNQNDPRRSVTPPGFSSSTNSQAHVLGGGGGVGQTQTNLQAEELLQWILDITDPSYVVHNHLHSHTTSNVATENNTCTSSPSSPGPSNNNSKQQHAPSTTSAAAPSHNSNKVGSNYTIRVPAGLESHPLASRCRQLATRYHATSAGTVVEDAAADSSSKNNNHNHNASELRIQSPKSPGSSKEGKSKFGARELSSGTSGPNSPNSIFSPAAFNHLKGAFNLSEADHGHLLLAVTDAMRIVLDWAGDALLVAENLARVVKLLVNGERCTVFVADERSQSLRTVIDGKPITVKFGQGIVGRCANQKVPLVVNNAYSHPSFNPSVDGEVNYITRNVLSMPMIVEGKLIAVVQVLNKQDSDFSEIDVEIFKAFTAVAGIVVRDAMTFPLTMRNLELAEGAKELCVQMMNVNMLSEKQAAQQWSTMLRGYLGSDSCTILRVQCNENPDGPGRINITPEQLDLTFVASDSEIDFGGFQPLPQKSIIAAALTNRAPELVNDARRDPRFDKQAARAVQNRASTSSLLVVPVFPFGDGEASCNHYLNSNATTSNNSASNTSYYHSSNHHHSAAPSGVRAQFCCYIVQFENFKENPLDIAVASNNNNKNNLNSLSPDRSNGNNDSHGDLGASTGGLSTNDDGSVSSANDIIFSDEAIEHVGRILPFFEIVLRSMNLIHAQRHQSALLHETARAIGHLCDEKLEINDAFDLLARTIESMIQGETKRGSVLFYTKVDSEGIECMQLLPRASLGPVRQNPSAAATSSSGGGAGGGNQGNASTTTNPHSLDASVTSHPQNNSAVLNEASVPPPPPSKTSPNTGGGNSSNSNNDKVHQHRAGHTFRLRRRSSVSHLAFNNIFHNEIKVPIGSGIVGTAVARVTPVLFNYEEANDLYSEGEFGPLVAQNDVPNCSVLVVPLAEGRTLMGAMIILRPRGDIVERVMDILGLGFGSPMSYSSSTVAAMNTMNNNNNNPGTGYYAVTTTAAGSSSSQQQQQLQNQNQYGSFAGPFMQSMITQNGPISSGSQNPAAQQQPSSNLTSPPSTAQQQQQNSAGPHVMFAPLPPNNNNNQQYGSFSGRNYGFSSNNANTSHHHGNASNGSNYLIDRNFDWTTVTSDQLVQPARVDFLSILVSVAKYVLKASSTVNALARQQESLLFSGELERLAMPTTNQASLKTNEKGSGSNLTGNNNNNPDEVLSNNNSMAGGVVGSPTSSNPVTNQGGTTTTNANNNANATGTSASKVLSSANFSQFTFGGKKSASPLDTPLKPEMFDLLSTTTFPIFDFVDGHQPAVGLVPLTVYMFRSLNCLNELQIDEAILTQAILKSFRRYRDVPYHNVFHAFDVTQSLFLFMKMAKLDEVFLPSERFAILLSAVFHDIDHNGLNNAYHAKAETPFGVIASLSGQKSVLEYHHCQVAIDVINSLQLLRHTSEEDRRRVLKVFFQCILGTDMALHREISQQLQSSFLGEDGVTRCFDRDNSEHRDLAAKMLLKMADISNPVKEFSLARRWALSVTEEFYRQGDVERLEGHDVLPMFDRQLNAELSKGQIGFITFMAGPFFNLAAKCFPEYQELTRNMDNNLSRWQKVQNSNVKKESE